MKRELLPQIKKTPKAKVKPPPRPRGFASPIQRARRLAAQQEGVAFPGVAGHAVETPPPPLEVQEINEMAQAIENMARWQIEPIVYVREVLGAEPDSWQAEALIALGQAIQNVPGAFDKFCLKACKGPGKSCLLAWVILWFMTCFEHPKVLVTSVTEDNLKDNLWAEISTWMNKSPMLIAMFQKDSEKLYARDHKDTWFCSVRTWPKEADKQKQATTLAGLHGKNTMVMIDESGTIPTGVLTAALAHHSTFDPTGEVPEVHLTFQAGNPDILDGCLGWACTVDSKNWWIKEITGDPKDPKRAPRIDKKWAQDQIDTFGADNPWVLVNVFGRFPPVGSDKLVGPDIVRTAMSISLPRETWRYYERVMALDVARSTGRDRSVLCRRQGSAVFPFLIYRLDDDNALAGQVAFEYSRWPAKFIVVDAVGIGGPVSDHLRAIGIPVVMFHGGLPARDVRRFADRRTETAWQAAQEIKGTNKEPTVMLPRLQEFVGEATSINLKWTSKGQMKLESKEEMLKRGINSPDLWDAYAMTFAEPVGFEQDHDVPASTVKAVKNQIGKVITEYDPYADED